VEIIPTTQVCWGKYVGFLTSEVVAAKAKLGFILHPHIFLRTVNSTGNSFGKNESCNYMFMRSWTFSQ
jgi:hypothetical protein